MIDFTRTREVTRPYQMVGALRVYSSPELGLFDDMGLGKTKQVIDGAIGLFLHGIINRVIVIAPAQLRDVWFDPELGELRKHLWYGVPNVVYEYHKRKKSWGWELVDGTSPLEWIITNYEWVRDEDRRDYVISLCDKSTMLVLEESAYVKNYKSKQSKASREIRKRCGRVVLLNGTPIAASPNDLYSQGNILTPKILECKSYFHFRSRYAKMGGWKGKQIVGWQNLEDLQTRFAPYVLRRERKDVLDLPEKLPSVALPVRLSPKTWKLYCEMRDEMVAWLDEQTVGFAAQAAVKVIRLAQITSGFLGGVAPVDLADPDRTDFQEPQPTQDLVVPFSDEKLDFLITWLRDRLAEDPQFKLIVWSRFVPEVQRVAVRLAEVFSQMTVQTLLGGQTREERDKALRIMDPRTTTDSPAVLIGTTQTGRVGFTLTASHTVVYLSNDFSLYARRQSEDRVHRFGQDHAVSYFDIVAIGPNGERTIDSHVFKSLRDKQNMADWTVSAWKDALLKE